MRTGKERPKTKSTPKWYIRTSDEPQKSQQNHTKTHKRRTTNPQIFHSSMTAVQ